MNLIYGEIVEIFVEEGMRLGRVRVSGAIRKISLHLLTNPNCGDRVLVCDGVAISKVLSPDAATEQNVFSDPR